MKLKKPRQSSASSSVDLAFVQGPTDDGEGARVVRLKDGVVSAGELRPAREGEPLNQRELVRLRPLSVNAPVCEVEVLHDGRKDNGAASQSQASEAAAREGSGPARVSSKSYRRNWSAIFGPARSRPGDYSVN